MKKIHIYHKKLSKWIDPEEVFVSLFGDKKQAFWLDSSKTDNSNNFSYMGFAAKVYKYRLDSGKEDVFSYLKKQLQEFETSRRINLPFSFIGGFVGYFGYELKALTGSKNTYKLEYPDSLWFFVDKFVAFDHKKQEMHLVCLAEGKKEAEHWFSKIELRLNVEVTRVEGFPTASSASGSEGEASTSTGGRDNKRQDPEEIGRFKLNRNHSQYLKDIEICKKYLRAGESYQLCLTNKITTESYIDPLRLYLTLRKINPAPYSAYIRFDDLAILCSSPEKFLSIDKDRTVISKPIKGTIKRGGDSKADLALAEKLRNDPKERAENLMIVDLLRNDLGKVCEIGSVSVPHLMDIESYATVHQLVSTVRGRLKKDLSIIDCIKACFPGGSMTGAPKIRTMELLEKLEASPRGIYSGSLGFLSLNGEVELNIVIRTIISYKNKLSIGLGGAILIDSIAEKEFEETMLKAKALMNAIVKAKNVRSSLNPSRHPGKSKRSKDASRIFKGFWTSQNDKSSHRIYLSLGSNIGDRKGAINKAIGFLKEKIVIEKIAPIYETKPVGFLDQENFYNTCISGKTNLTPDELLFFLKDIEKLVGRIKRFRNGPREIDIDILTYDDLVLKSKNLVIPHSEMINRDFVLQPLSDIAPDTIHPTTLKRISELLAELSVEKSVILGKI